MTIALTLIMSFCRTLGLSSLLIIASATVLWAPGSHAQIAEQKGQLASDGFAFWPGARYDAAVPTLKSVLGHANGERITSPRDTIRYFEELAAHAPDRVKIVEYAKSWEGRPLIYVVIGTPERVETLDGLKAGMQALRDPRKTDQATADQLINTLPATTWIAYGVHGNEISGTDAAIMTAYHLLAAQDDPVVDAILSDSVVIIDPMQNPDGRARFVHNYETTAGLEADGSSIAAERREPWPGGRTNHYLFDMNRDWFALTQPETQGRVKTLTEWLPLVFVDAHEMGTDSTYYFAPEAVPYNPHLAADQRASLTLFGQNNAKWFDANGFDYFTREVYDAFYPGYGASWPSYYGAVAMTYEQASARGLKARRRDGTSYDYRDTVRQHFVASIATAETTAKNREKLLRDFYAYQKSAIAEGASDDIRAYILPATRDRAAATKIAGLLTRQGVEVNEANEDFEACGTAYGAGAFVINLNQPAKRLIRTLMDKDVALDKTFVAEQERLRAKGLPDQIYDVTAWSMPLMYGAAADPCSSIIETAMTPYAGALHPKGSIKNKEASVAFLVPWGEAPAARLLAHAFRHDLTVKSTDKAFTQGGQSYPAGTLIFPVKENADTLGDMLGTLATQTGARVIGVDTGWVTEGPNFGSRNVVRMHPPKIALAWDAPTNAYAAGNTRFVIERQFDYPVTPVRVADLSARGLDGFDVLVITGERGGYGARYKDLVSNEAIKAWVRKGGILITTGAATRWAAHPDTGLLSIRREDAVRDEMADTDDDDKNTVSGTILEDDNAYAAAINPVAGRPDGTGGVLLKAVVDPDHWLGAGITEEITVLARGGDIYTPARRDDGTNVVRFADAPTLLTSGYLWKETRAQMAYKPYLVNERLGSGQIIAFTQDPTVRAYLDGLNVLFMNALFRSPAHAGPYR
ncbi:MAG: M14 metallopeptidase family protein [Pseudomonadota bacterium]